MTLEDKLCDNLSQKGLIKDLYLELFQLISEIEGIYFFLIFSKGFKSTI